jgi:hypothetical protein
LTTFAHLSLSAPLSFKSHATEKLIKTKDVSLGETTLGNMLILLPYEWVQVQSKLISILRPQQEGRQQQDGNVMVTTMGL